MHIKYTNLINLANRVCSLFIAICITISISSVGLINIANAAGVEYTAGAKDLGYATVDSNSIITTADSGIDFNLYNYSQDINKTSSGEFRNIASHMMFAGAQGGTGDTPSSNTEQIQLGLNRMEYELNLDPDGYPVISEKSASGLNYSDRQIGYLFGKRDQNGSTDHAVTAYENISNTPLQLDSSGYYYYKSYANAVDYVGNESSGYIELYTEPERGHSSAKSSLGYSSYKNGFGNFYAPTDNPNDVMGDFFPFSSQTNNIKTISGTDPAGVSKNIKYHYDTDTSDSVLASPKYWFGATMTANFYQPKNGQINNKDMVFEFSGDDDILVYLDSILVMNLGGAHSRCDGSINLTTGLVETYYNAPNTFGVTSCSWGNGTPNAALHYNHKNRAENAALNNCLASGTGDYAGYYYHYGFNRSADEWSLIRYYPTTIYDCYKAAYIESNPDISETELNSILNDIFEPVLDTNGNQLEVEDAFGNSHLQYQFRDYTEHSFNWFYLERYSGEANFNVKFNFPTLPENSLTVAKEVGGTTSDVSFEFEATFKDENGDYLESVKYTTASGDSGTMQLINGTGSFRLADSEYYTFELATGYTYDVVEIDADKNGYITSWSRDTSGVIGEESVYLACTNRLQDVSLVTSKRISSESDGLWITLDAYGTGEYTTIENVKPADIVLVLDQSSSMQVPMGYDKYHYSGYDFSVDSQGYNTVSHSYDEIVNSSELQQKAEQVGYFVTQSTRTHNWYVVEKTPDGWKYYIVSDAGLGTYYAHRYYKYVLNSEGKAVLSGNLSDPIFIDANHPNGETDVNHKTYIVDDIENVHADLRGEYYVTQYGALYDALIMFINNVRESGIDHRIALVGFSGNSFSLDDGDTDYATVQGINVSKRQLGSGIYTGNTGNGYYLYSSPINGTGKGEALDYYDDALFDISTDEGYSNIMKSINRYTPSYAGTNWAIGLDMASRIFAANPISDDESRDRVAILFTDGEASGTLETEDTTKGVGSAINYSYMVKNSYDPDKQVVGDEVYIGAKVYTISTSTATGYNNLEYVSSDYPNATYVYAGGTGITGTEVKQSGYSGRIETASELSNIFSTISDNISNPKTSLDSRSIMFDILSEYFVLDSNGDRDIEILVSHYNGESFDTAENHTSCGFCNLEYSIGTLTNGIFTETLSGDTIKVTGFDYSTHFVAEGAEGGYKLIVRIPVQPSDSNPGGMKQPTNADSGLYNEGEKVTSFGEPSIDIPSVITVTKIIDDTAYDANFEFTIDYGEFKGYGEPIIGSDGSNYLPAIWEDKTITKQLGDNESFILENVRPKEEGVQATITITEEVPDGYYSEITVYVDGEVLDKSEYTINENGITVGAYPNMRIEILNYSSKELPNTGGYSGIASILLGIGILSAVIIIVRARGSKDKTKK